MRAALPIPVIQLLRCSPTPPAASWRPCCTPGLNSARSARRTASPEPARRSRSGGPCCRRFRTREPRSGSGRPESPWPGDSARAGPGPYTPDIPGAGAHLGYSSDVIEVVETYLYRLLVEPVMMLVRAAKRLQSGRLDAYLVYMLIALIALIAIVLALA
jgi:hypothetical protein